MYVAIGGGLSGRPERGTSRQETVVKPCLHSLLFVYFRRSRESSMVAHCINIALRRPRQEDH